MREILFKAKRIDNGEWVEGQYVYITNPLTEDGKTIRRVDEVIGWHTEVIETDALSKCEPFCLPMPLTDFYIERSEFEVYGNIFDNPELLEVE